MKIKWYFGTAVNFDGTVTHYTRKDLMTVLPETNWKPLAGYEKFVSPCLPPEGYERELLVILIEECAEIAQRATKMLRFGVEEVQPGQGWNNAERLDQEIGDLVAVLRRLQEIETSNPFRIEAAAQVKNNKLDVYMQTEKPNV